MNFDSLWCYSKFQVKESKWLVKCFLNYLRHDKSEVNVLFDMLSIFLVHTRIDYTFLKEFYIIEVCKSLMLMHPNSLLIFSLIVVCFSSLGSFMCVVTFSLSLVSGCWRLCSKYEKDTSLAFFAAFSIKTTCPWSLGCCHANAHSSNASAHFSEWPELGSCWPCYHKNNCWQATWSSRRGGSLLLELL